MTEPEAARAIDQVSDALSYLHDNNTIHRDIKPENVVMVMGVAKVCDLGWATFDGGVMHGTFCGTLDYVSPEMKDRGEYGNSVDLWSLGVMTFELLVGFPPFKQ
jgi:serine/threonine protein kinase